MSEWIAVKDKPPPIYQSVWAYTSKGQIIEAHRTGPDINAWMVDGFYPLSSGEPITHWMTKTRPDPPRAEREDCVHYWNGEYGGSICGLTGKAACRMTCQYDSPWCQYEPREDELSEQDVRLTAAIDNMLELEKRVIKLEEAFQAEQHDIWREGIRRIKQRITELECKLLSHKHGKLATSLKWETPFWEDE